MGDSENVTVPPMDGVTDEVALLRLALTEERRRRERAERALSATESTSDAARDLRDTTPQRQSEARFRTAFQNSSVGMALSELDGRFVLVNRAMCTILGYSEAELLEMSGPDIVHPDHRIEHVEAHRQLVAGDIDRHESEKRYLRKDNRMIWGIGNLALVRDDEGFPINIICQLQDVTERKAAEDALRGSEARLRAIIDHSPTAIFLRDRDGRYLLANSEYERRNGFAPGTVVGKTVHELFPRERADYFMSRDRSIFEMGQLTQRKATSPSTTARQ